MTGQQKILIPVDGSANCERAVKHVVEMIKAGHTAEIHVLNVQLPISGDVSSFVGRGAIEGYHKDEAEKALAPTKQALDAAGIAYKVHI